MNTLLIFFAFPIAVIIFSIVLEKLLKNPIIVASLIFAVFIIYYAIHAGWNPNECDNFTHVFSLRGNNIITKGLLKVKNLLCKNI